MKARVKMRDGCTGLEGSFVIVFDKILVKGLMLRFLLLL